MIALDERSLATEPATSRAWWFLGTLAVLRNPEGAPLAPTVIELTVPPGGSPAMHIHETADDNFLLLEGEVTVLCGGRALKARPGAYVALPAGVPHTFRVTSEGPAKMLLVQAGDEFLKFIQAVGKPAPELVMPPRESGVDRETLVRAGEANAVRFVGPPLDAEAAAALEVV